MYWEMPLLSRSISRRTWKGFDPFYSFRKNYVCLPVYTHAPFLPFCFTFSELILQAKQKRLVLFCGPPIFFSLFYLIFQWKLFLMFFVGRLLQKIFYLVLLTTNHILSGNTVTFNYYHRWVRAKVSVLLGFGLNTPQLHLVVEADRVMKDRSRCSGFQLAICSMKSNADTLKILQIAASSKFSFRYRAVLIFETVTEKL